MPCDVAASYGKIAWAVFVETGLEQVQVFIVCPPHVPGYPAAGGSSALVA